MKLKPILGLILMAGFASLLFLNFGEQVGGYMNFEEAARTGSQAHVIGHWVEDMASTYDPERNIFSFYMQDEAGTVRQIHYANPKPANFEEAEKLVIEGFARDDVFVAEYILMKCPSKYNDQNGLQQISDPSL